MAVAELAVAGIVLGLVELAMVLSGPPIAPRWILALFPVVGWIYLVAGVVAWLRRPSNRMGALMVAGAFAWLAAGFVNTTVPGLIAGGLILATVPLALVVHLLHAFPSGRLLGRVSWVTVLTGYGVCTILQAPQYLFGQGPESPWTVLQIADRADLARAGQYVQWVVGGSVMVVTAAMLARRLAGVEASRRRVSAPLFVYGIVAVLFVPVSAEVARDFFPGGGVALAATQLTVLAGVPVAFVAAMLRGGFARTGELEELGAWLGADTDRPPLADALADALGDRSLELAFWVPETGAYVAGDGRPIALPAAGSDRAAVEVALGERRVGAIAYDATLIADPGLVRAAGRVITLALDNERLTAELRASREDVRASRARIVEAADDDERRRIARDLHDGLQARLVLLAVRAHAVGADRTASPAVREQTVDLNAGLQTAISELRELVQGVMPAALTERGLYAAAEELADRVPIPIELDLDAAGGPLPAPVESTGYFVVSEALANAVKHSRARELVVRLHHSGAWLRIEVSDDAAGGALVGAGSGLRGIADRVAALGGRLVVDSPIGGGTRVLAEVPCGS